MKSTERQLSEKDIKVILRAADTIIAQGGRTLLAKILRGSKEKKLLELELDQCPVYGYFKTEKTESVMQKIDWMIDYGFLAIEYSGKLPMIIFTRRGWEIEMNQRADEFLAEWREWIAEGKEDPDMSYLRDRNREMVLLFLQKVRETSDPAFIPYLKLWEKTDFKKVRAEIRKVISQIEHAEPVDQDAIHMRKESLMEALEGEEPSDIYLKCWNCGTRFVFTVGEQKFFEKRRLTYPRRCQECRNEDRWGE